MWQAAVAAALALVFVGLWTAWSPSSPTKPPAFTPMAMEKVYFNRVKAGFTADWKCESDQEFSDTFMKWLGANMTMHETERVACVGLSYCRAITENTLTVFARVDGKEVMVFVDRLTKDTHPTVPESTGLRVFRKEAPPLVFYEVTPLEQAEVFPLFSEPIPPPRSCE